jgi:hypothetical protein
MDTYIGIWEGEYRVYSQSDELLNRFKVRRNYWWEGEVMMGRVVYEFASGSQNYYHRIILSEGYPYAFVTDTPTSDQVRSALKGSSVKGTLIWTRVLPQGSLPVRISERITTRDDVPFIEFWGDQEAKNAQGNSMLVRIDGFLAYLPGSREESVALSSPAQPILPENPLPEAQTPVETTAPETAALTETTAGTTPEIPAQVSAPSTEPAKLTEIPAETQKALDTLSPLPPKSSAEAETPKEAAPETPKSKKKKSKQRELPKEAPTDQALPEKPAANEGTTPAELPATENTPTAPAETGEAPNTVIPTDPTPAATPETASSTAPEEQPVTAKEEPLVPHETEPLPSAAHDADPKVETTSPETGIEESIQVTPAPDKIDPVPEEKPANPKAKPAKKEKKQKTPAKQPKPKQKADSKTAGEALPPPPPLYPEKPATDTQPPALETPPVSENPVTQPELTTQANAQPTPAESIATEAVTESSAETPVPVTETPVSPAETPEPTPSETSTLPIETPISTGAESLSIETPGPAPATERTPEPAIRSSISSLQSELEQLKIVGVKTGDGENMLLVDYYLIYKPGQPMDTQTPCTFTGIVDSMIHFMDLEGNTYSIPVPTLP